MQSCVCKLKHDVLLLVYGTLWPATKFRYFPEATRPFTNVASTPHMVLAVKVLRLNNHLLPSFIYLINYSSLLMGTYLVLKS